MTLEGKLLDIKQLVEMYPAFTEWSVRDLIRHRRIPIVRIGSRIYFDPEDISDWIQRQKIEPVNEGGGSNREE